jgi:hypothetical protein
MNVSSGFTIPFSGVMSQYNDIADRTLGAAATIDNFNMSVRGTITRYLP